MPTERLYVITHRQLGDNGVAQLVHGASQFMLDFPGAWLNTTIVCLAVKDLEALEFWQDKLQMKGYKFSKFREPDIGNQLTSIACATDSKIFSKLEKF